MPYRVRIDPLAMRQIDEFAAYLRDYSEDFAREQIERLDRILRFNLGESPLTWSYFPLTGAPYRAYLFRVGRRTHYWIIYTADEDNHTVDVLSFWNTARDPESFKASVARIE
jgi:mRNA-degrading endonuclease RelE of RelBE toxin-antitoxin system